MTEPERHRKNDFKAARADVERQLQEARAQFDEVSATLERRTGRNLIFAVGVGLVLGAVFLFSVIFVTDVFMGVAALAIGFATVELATALRQSGRDVPRIPAVIAAVAVSPAAFYGGPPGAWLAILAGAAFVVLWRLAEQFRVRTSGRALAFDLTSAVLIQAYVAALAGFAVLLTSPSSPDGRWWTLAAIIVVVATDTGAYAGGLLLGRHPMAPTISPKKTWEGFAAAALVAFVAGVVLALFMLHALWWFGLVFGAVLLVTATVGDLAESLIKRDIGVKDMSGWLPGHGGILDRLDSILPSAAAAYALYLVFHPLFTG